MLINGFSSKINASQLNIYIYCGSKQNIVVNAAKIAARMITRAIGSRVSRSMAAAVKLKDAKLTQPKTRTPKYVKILIPGDENVMWKQKVTKRYAVFVKIENNKQSRDQRSVLAGEDMPFGALVTFTMADSWKEIQSEKRRRLTGSLPSPG